MNCADASAFPPPKEILSDPPASARGSLPAHAGASVPADPAPAGFRPSAGSPWENRDRPQKETPGSSGHWRGHGDRSRPPSTSRRKRRKPPQHGMPATHPPEYMPAEPPRQPDPAQRNNKSHPYFGAAWVRSPGPGTFRGSGRKPAGKPDPARNRNRGHCKSAAFPLPCRFPEYHDML